VRVVLFISWEEMQVHALGVCHPPSRGERARLPAEWVGGRVGGRVARP